VTGTTLVFTTIFLATSLGTYPVDVDVSPDPQAVEFLLNGTVAGRVESAPWRLDVDFGKELRPHRLEAVAYDAEGRELARTEQWINVPRQDVEVLILPRRSEEGRMVGGRVAAVAADGRPPRSVVVTLDGVPVAMEETGHFSIPPYESERIHVLAAEARFPGDRRASYQLAFGGRYGTEVLTALTAVPLRLRRQADPPSEDRVAGWLEAMGEAARVVRVERPAREVILVRDHQAESLLARLGKQLPAVGLRGLGDRTGYLPWAPEPGDILKEVRSVPKRVVREDGGVDSIHSILAFDAEFANPPRVLVGGVPSGADARSAQRLADAVLVAGFTAASASHRRAVVVALRRGTPDESAVEPMMVRRYLTTLHVPLHVWTIGGRGDPEYDGSWGEVASLTGPPPLRDAMLALTEDLDRQVVVWLDGRYMPQDIELTGEGRRHARLAGDR
jgi:hypothetical protein